MMMTPTEARTKAEIAAYILLVRTNIPSLILGATRIGLCHVDTDPMTADDANYYVQLLNILRWTTALFELEDGKYKIEISW